MIRLVYITMIAFSLSLSACTSDREDEDIVTAEEVKQQTEQAQTLTTEYINRVDRLTKEREDIRKELDDLKEKWKSTQSEMDSAISKLEESLEPLNTTESITDTESVGSTGNRYKDSTKSTFE